MTWNLTPTRGCDNCDCTRTELEAAEGRDPAPTGEEAGRDAESDKPLVHWVGEHNNTIHGNGAAVMQPTSGDEDEVTCTLCHTLLARMAREAEDERDPAAAPTGGTESGEGDRG